MECLWKQVTQKGRPPQRKAGDFFVGNVPGARECSHAWATPRARQRKASIISCTGPADSVWSPMARSIHWPGCGQGDAATATAWHAETGCKCFPSLNGPFQAMNKFTGNRHAVPEFYVKCRFARMKVPAARLNTLHALYLPGDAAQKGKMCMSAEKMCMSADYGTKMPLPRRSGKIPVTRRQIVHEWKKI